MFGRAFQVYGWTVMSKSTAFVIFSLAARYIALRLRQRVCT